MPQYLASITVDNVIDALGNFIQPFVDSAEIVRAQVNRVPMPEGPCVVLTELLEVGQNVPVIMNDAANEQIASTESTRIDIQIDFYGPSAGDWCKAIKAAYRTIWATGQFPDGIKPLYCSDGIQSPLITGEQQWESRWTLTASLQYNPTVQLPQQFADTLAATVKVPADLL